MTLGYDPPSFAAPRLQATQEAAITGRQAWVLAFAATPPLGAPSAQGNASVSTRVYAAYYIVDAATGAVIQACDVDEDTAEGTAGPLPALSPEGERCQPIDVAPVVSFARFDRLLAGEDSWTDRILRGRGLTYTGDNVTPGRLLSDRSTRWHEYEKDIKVYAYSTLGRNGKI